MTDEKEQSSLAGVRLFGVQLAKDSSLMRKSASTGHFDLKDEQPISPNRISGYLSDGPIHVPALKRKKDGPWTEEEHRGFLLGLRQLGKGDWRGISRKFVKSRTPTQVASHAQKYFLRHQGSAAQKKKRRVSVFDRVEQEVPSVLSPRLAEPDVTLPRGSYPLSCDVSTPQRQHFPPNMKTLPEAIPIFPLPPLAARPMVQLQGFTGGPVYPPQPSQGGCQTAQAHSMAHLAQSVSYSGGMVASRGLLGVPLVQPGGVVGPGRGFRLDAHGCTFPWVMMQEKGQLTTMTPYWDTGATQAKATLELFPLKGEAPRSPV